MSTESSTQTGDVFVNVEKSEADSSSDPLKVSSNSVLLNVSDLDSNPICRICYNGGSKEKLLRPCKCKGTIEYVHRRCLERWLESTNCQTCELCHHHYATRRTRKALWECCRQEESQFDRRNFIGDCFCFAFLTPLGIATFWLCAEGALYYQRIKSSTLETVALVSLAVFLLLAYSTWIVLCSRYHLMIWNRWRNRNWNVRIIDRDSPIGGNQQAQDVSTGQSSPCYVQEPMMPTRQPIRIQPVERNQGTIIGANTQPLALMANYLFYGDRDSNV